MLQKLTEWERKLQNTIDLLGEIAAAAKIQGRTEGIGTTVAQLDSGGVVLAGGVDFTRAYTNKNLGNVPDDATTDRRAVTADQRTGGGRGFVALDGNNRLAGSFRNNPVNAAAIPTSSTILDNDGAATLITIAANTVQFGEAQVSYNSGSVDPGVFGTFYIFADDPTFAGGAVTYQFSTDPIDQLAADGRVFFGGIITTSGTPQTGGGSSGGSSGSGGSGGGKYNTL